MKSILKTFIPLSLVFAVLVSTNFLYAAWTAPAGTPAAGNNASNPVNTSSIDQVKTGGLSVGALSVTNNVYIQGGNTAATPSGTLNLEVEGKIGSGQFCDTTGVTCFSAAQARAAIDGALPFTVYTVFDKKYYWGGARWFGADYYQRVSAAKATCTTGDFAIAGREIAFDSEIPWANNYTQVINGYNRLSPTYFDAQNIAWVTPSNPTYQYKRVYNGYNRWGSRGSYVGTEVKCLNIDLTKL